MSRKRPLESEQSSESGTFFGSLRDKEMFEIERNILTRIVYKNHYQFRRIDIIDRVKMLVKALDELYVRNDTASIPQLLREVEWASERFFQHVTMGLMVTLSMTCIASLARIAEILRRVPAKPTHMSIVDGDEGVPIAR